MAVFSSRLRSQTEASTVEPLESRITPSSVAFPSVVSIATVGKASTEDTTVSWKVTFSEPVTGVDAADFALALSGGLAAPGALTVTPVSATVYTVKTTGLIGSGSVGLNLVDDGSIRDVDNHPLKADSLSFSKPLSLSGEGYISSVATGDVNGDGKADLVATELYSNSVYVYLGNGDGSFQAKQIFTTASSPRSVAIADLNGDGKLDLAVAASGYNQETSASTTVSVLLGNGDGTFQAKHDFGTGYGSLAVKAGDFNKDGKLDLAVTSDMSGLSSVNILLGNGDGTFQSQRTFPTGSTPQGLALGDVNKDGKLDVVVANTNGNTISVLLGSGNGDLKAKVDFATDSSPNSVVLADLNGDGKLDVATAGGNQTGSVSVLLGNGKGSFGAKTSYPTGSQTAGISAADFDGDGKLDLAVTHQLAQINPTFNAPLIEGSSFVGVLLGNGNGTFQTTQDFFLPASKSGPTALADFDGNGRTDIATANLNDGSNSILPNIGEKDFTGTQFTVGTVPSDLAITGFTDNKTDAGPGDLLTYVVDFANQSSKGATGVKLTVILPDGTSFVAKENPGWTLSGTTLTKTVGKLAGGKAGNAKLKLHVDKTTSTYASGIYTVATISDDGNSGEDSNSENNSRNDYDQRTGFTPDLAVTAIDDGGIAFAGETTTYKIKYNNVGSRDANAKITVTLPTGTTFNAGASTAGWVDNLDGTFTLDSLTVPVGTATSSVDFAVDVDSNVDTRVPLSLPATIASTSLSETNLTNNTLTEETPFYSGIYVTSPGVAVGKKFAPPLIHVFDRATGLEVRSFLAYEPEYRDSIRVAVGDFNDDGVDDIVTTTQGGTGRLRVFDGRTGEMMSSGPFSEEVAVFDGVHDKGAFVAVGDVNGDGNDDIVVGSALGGGKVKVYSGVFLDRTVNSGPDLIKEYTPFGAGFKGGVRVAVGEVNGQGNDSPNLSPDAPFHRDDIIVGEGFYGGHVIVYDGDTDTKLQDFSVGGKNYKGGVSVAAGDLDGDGRADIVVGRNSGKPGIVEIFKGTDLTPIGKSINPFDADPAHPKNIYGVRVAVVDVNLDGIADIITSVGVKNDSQVKIYSGLRNQDGSYNILEDRTITAYENYPDVALWVAGSRGIPRILV